MRGGLQAGVRFPTMFVMSPLWGYYDVAPTGLAHRAEPSERRWTPSERRCTPSERRWTPSGAYAHRANADAHRAEPSERRWTPSERRWTPSEVEV